MRKTGSGLRRGAAVLVMTMAVMAISGAGASAAPSGLPAILNGKADSQALRLKVTLPSVAQLEAALSKVLGTTVDLPDVDLPDSVPTTIEQVVSLNHAEVMRAASGKADQASGFAAATLGNLPLLGNQSVSSRCAERGSCTRTPAALAGQTLSLPAGLGKVRVAAAESVTKSLTETRNSTALAQTNLSLAELLKTAGASEALKTLTDVVNGTVLPIVNPQLEAAEKLISDTLEGAAPAVKSELDRIITLGTIKNLPQLDKVGLLDLTVLGAKADIAPKTLGGVKGLEAIATSKVTDVDILGGWATIDAVGLVSRSYANGKKGAGFANSDVQIAGLDLGGALGIHIEEEDIKRLLNDPSSLIEAIAEDAGGVPEGLKPAFDEIVASLELLQTIAGISYEFFEETTNIDPKGRFASSKAGTLKLVVEPKIPTLEALTNNTPGVGAIVPRLEKDDFVSTGIRMEVELPNASTAIATGDVKDLTFVANPRTGVATPAIIALMLIGAAIVVRRFALAK